jgi:hypothetical protein
MLKTKPARCGRHCEEERTRGRENTRGSPPRVRDRRSIDAVEPYVTAAHVYAERPRPPRRLRTPSPSLSPKRPQPVVTAGVIASLARILTLSVEVPLLLLLVSSPLIGGEFSADISVRAMLDVYQVKTVGVLCAQLERCVRPLRFSSEFQVPGLTRNCSPTMLLTALTATNLRCAAACRD